VRLAYVDDLSQRQIAERIGLPLGTVKSRTYHALRALREHLKEGSRMPDREVHLDLAAYALDSLDAGERVRFERHLVECQSCRRELADFVEVAELLRSSEAPEPPAALRRRTLDAVTAAAGGESEPAPESPSGRRWWSIRRPAIAGGLAVAAAVAVVAIVLTLPAGGPAGPSVGQAAALAELSETVAAVHPAGAFLVDRDGSGVPFPNWHRAFAWHATGGRDDELAGRTATTTFYQRVGGASELAYTIVSGDPLAVPRGSESEARGDRVFHTARIDGRGVVVFERLGHTCVLSGEASLDQLVKLAAWAGGGEVPF
jgi:anti-sigma factor RsiW